MEFHNGIDIGVPIGTQLKAVGYGIVTEISESKTFGLYLKYQTNEYTFMYAHLDKINVIENQEIFFEDVVALSGNTGLSTGPHLHISMWKNDELVDPVIYLDYKSRD